MIVSYASPKLRDRFITALDADDRALSSELALDLTGCVNPLPGITCNQLGIPIGSTYGSAARCVLLRNLVDERSDVSGLVSNAVTPDTLGRDR